MGADLTLGCRCGALQGVLSVPGPKAGSHVVCYCKDCQAFARHLEASDMLDEQGGSHIYQTLPSRLEIVRGQDHLACLRLSPKGLLRWYAKCCDTPLCNTVSNPRIHLVSILVPALQGNKDALGPVRAHVNTSGACGAPIPESGRNGVILAFLRRQIGAMLTGRTGNPLLTSSGVPICEPLILSLAERQAATPAHAIR